MQDGKVHEPQAVAAFHRFVKLGVDPKDWDAAGLPNMASASVGRKRWLSLRSTHPTNIMRTNYPIAPVHHGVGP